MIPFFAGILIAIPFFLRLIPKAERFAIPEVRFIIRSSRKKIMNTALHTAGVCMTVMGGFIVIIKLLDYFSAFVISRTESIVLPATQQGRDWFSGILDAPFFIALAALAIGVLLLSVLSFSLRRRLKVKNH